MQYHEKQLVPCLQTIGARCEGEVDLSDLILKCVSSGVSVGARDKATGELVGVRLSSILSSKPKTEPPPDSIPPEVVSSLHSRNGSTRTLSKNNTAVECMEIDMVLCVRV